MTRQYTKKIHKLNLHNFQRAASFLRAQGIEPNLDMLRLEPGEWRSLLDLAAEWEKQVKAHQQPTLTDEEIEEEKKREYEANLYHSAY